MATIILIAVMLMLSSFIFRCSFEYFICLRIATCGVLAVHSFLASKANRFILAYVSALMLLVFNPVAPIHLDRSGYEFLAASWNTVLLAL